jgi:lipoprotein signal peptidase
MSDGSSGAAQPASDGAPASVGLSWRQKLVVPGVLLAVDLATKYLAFFALRDGSSLSFGAGLGGNPRPLVAFGYLANDTGSNALVDQAGVGSAAFLILFSVCYALIAGAAILLNRLRAPRRARGFSYAGIVAAYAIAVSRLASASTPPALAIGPWPLSLIRFAGGLVFGFTFLALAKERGYARIWGLFVAGGLGNFLCILLPPFAVIDFINLPRIPAAANLYFNLADLYVVAFWAALLLWAMLRRILRSRSRPLPRGRGAAWTGDAPDTPATPATPATPTAQTTETEETEQ